MNRLKRFEQLFFVNKPCNTVTNFLCFITILQRVEKNLALWPKKKLKIKKKYGKSWHYVQLNNFWLESCEEFQKSINSSHQVYSVHFFTITKHFPIKTLNPMPSVALFYWLFSKTCSWNYNKYNVYLFEISSRQ